MWRLGLTVNVSTLQLKTLETGARGILEILPFLRNILQPVNRLPPEILSRVARCSLDEDARDASSIVPLTHVCRYWRESITSAPENWTLISDDRIELAKLSLGRAKAARLDVTIDIHQFGAESFGLIADHTKNINTLRVQNLPGHEELTAAVPGFPRSTPNLQSLTLLCSYTSDKWDQSIDPFKSLSPTLTCLSLFNVPLYPSLHNLRRLTDLTLRYHRFNLSLDSLLDFLEYNLWLESATLDIRFTEPALRNSRRREPIRNRLQHLSISCNNPTNVWAKWKFLIFLPPKLGNPLRRVPSALPHQRSRALPGTSLAKVVSILSRLPEAPPIVLPSPRSAFYRKWCRFARPPLHFAIKSFGFAFSQHPRVFGLFYHRTFYGGPDAVRL